MCGITGIYAFNEAGRFHHINLQKSTDLLRHRGPDAQGSYIFNRVGFGHRRLSVIDLSTEANQPMQDASGRYWIVYNGEIYNYKLIRQDLANSGIRFKTQSDTEVLLNTYIHYGVDGLQKLNGFFAFAIYDTDKDELFIARDRYGIKPLYYYLDEDKLIFASELRSVMIYGIEKSINYTALSLYFQLNYIPAPLTIFKDVQKLLPGHYLLLKEKKVELVRYYNLPENHTGDYRSDSVIRTNIRTLLEKSVERRLIADVTVGSFLSGGIDSSIITGIASRFTNNLNTFSIGYSDEPYFDETNYANLVAKHFNTNHTVFKLSKRNLYDYLYDVLDHIDEPFADSSSLPVYILSKETKKHASVALSGDGADELFAGYNKHNAFYRIEHPGINEYLVYKFRFLWNLFPGSRNNKLSNINRQLKKFSEGYRLNPMDRYWHWASVNTPAHARSLLNKKLVPFIREENISELKHQWLAHINKNLDSVLRTDLEFMLPNDMLYKVDLMSMAHGLEVRVPFLDHEFVEYVTGVPSKYKISSGQRKIILKDAFREILPAELMKRAKKGFEVPLLNWFRTDLRSLIDDQLLNNTFINEQGIFDSGEISMYKKQLNTAFPGDKHAHIWALIVFQWWWKKNFK